MMWHVVDSLGHRIHGPDSLTRCLEVHGAYSSCGRLLFVERVRRDFVAVATFVGDA